MMYLKTPASPGDWDIYPADQLRWSSTYFQVPAELRDPGVVPGIEHFRDFFIAKEVDEALATMVTNFIVCVPLLRAEVKFSEQDDCVKWALRELDGEMFFHVFQGYGFVQGENGQTIERI